MDIQFRDIQSRNDALALITFLEKQRLGYQNYDSWLEKTLVELDAGIKSAVTAHYNGRLVGDLVYQPHKQLKNVLELKNLRTHPDVRDRRFAGFMLRQVETEQNQHHTIICDVRSSEEKMISFLQHNGYQQVLKLNLYDQNNTDIVFAKFLREPSEEIKRFFIN
ncbi:MAG: hypothetical protein KC535_03180 [Nanoarchaeota archaeon]|nr:hypothetical protein [Nanoarchaeota archaeon]